MRLNTWRRCSAIAMVCALSIFGQTKVDVRTQTKSIDFSNSGPTKPVRTGTALPSTCSVGEFFFLTTAPAGQNLYGCPATNMWTLEGGVVSSANLVPTQTGNSGTILTTNGTTPSWTAFGGDIAGSFPSLKVSGLMGHGLSSATPADGQLLKFNVNSGLWEPITLGGDVSGAPASLQVSGLMGRSLSTAVPTNGSLLRFNTGNGLWEPIPGGSDLSNNGGALQVSGLLGRGISPSLPLTGQVLSFNSGSNLWVPTGLGGDVSGAFSTLTVSGIQGRGVSSTAPSDGQLFGFSGSASLWQPVSLGGDVTGGPSSVSVSGLRGKTVSSVPPSDGQLLRYNGTTAQWEATSLGGDVSGISGLVRVNGLLGRTLSTVAPANGQILKWNAITSVWEAVSLGGDVSGTPSAVTVLSLQGHGLSNAAPSNAQVLSWNSVANLWTPTSVQAPPNYSAGFTSATTVSILGTQHNLNTANLIVSCYDNGTPSNIIEPSNLTVDPSTYNVAVSFQTAQTGRCVVNGSGGLTQIVTGAGGAGLTAQLGDFNVTQTNSTTLAVGVNCSIATPCNVRFGTTTRSITAGFTATISAGTGTAYLYITSDGSLNVGSSGLTLGCSAGCLAQTGTVQFPANSFPVYTWNALNGSWSTGGGNDMRAAYSTNPISGGTGIVVTQSNLASTIAVDSNVVPVYLTGTATLTFSSIASAACSAEQTVSLTGALPGDGIAAGWPAIPAGMIGMMRVSVNDTVAVKLCNFSGATASVSALVYKATIVRGS